MRARVQLFTVILPTLVRSQSRPHRPFSSAFVVTQEQFLYTVIWSLAGREAIRSYLPRPFLLFMVTTMWLPQTLSPRGSAKSLLYPRTHIDPLDKLDFCGATDAHRQVHLSAEGQTALAPLLSSL